MNAKGVGLRPPCALSEHQERFAVPLVQAVTSTANTKGITLLADTARRRAVAPTGLSCFRYALLVNAKGVGLRPPCALSEHQERFAGALSAGRDKHGQH